MILTKVIKHTFDFSKELSAARRIAEFAIKNRDKLSSKYVKHLGLKSAISAQILRKYGRNKKCKEVHNVNLIVPGQGLRLDASRTNLTITPLKTTVSLKFFPLFSKINQVEISEDKIFVSFTVDEAPEKSVTNFIGVDRNATGHIAVAANPGDGSVLKLGKLASHFRRKYRGRKKCGRFMNDLDHKISKKIVQFAKQKDSGIALEKLKGIRPKKSKGKKLNRILHGWSFYRLQTYIQYKARILGVPVVFVNPAYTSKKCSRCGCFGIREDKSFKCSCGHVDHADANAAFNIGRLAIDRDIVKRSTDSPPV